MVCLIASSQVRERYDDEEHHSRGYTQAHIPPDGGSGPSKTQGTGIIGGKPNNDGRQKRGQDDHADGESQDTS